MRNFIWMDNRVINLAHVLYFTVEHEKKSVTAVLDDGPDSQSSFTVTGKDALALIRALNKPGNQG